MSSTTVDRSGPDAHPTPGDELASEQRAALDAALEELRAYAGAWARLGPAQRGALLDEVLAGLVRVGPRIVEAALEAKGLPSGGHAEGEEWLNVATYVRYARLLRRSLAEIERHGHPRLPHPPYYGPGDQAVTRVYPDDIYEELTHPGMHAEVWMRPGVSLEETIATQAWAYRAPHAGQVAAVLGAGSLSSLIPLDILYQLFVEGRVVAFKFSPLNAYLEPLFAEAFMPLIASGYLRLLPGGAMVGFYLAHHPAVDHVHLTGSRETCERLLAGPPPLARPLTAELGNVTPVIIVPGPWKPAELEMQARALATWAVFNGGFLCYAPRVIIQQRQWALRHEFLGRFEQILAATPTRRAWHPGSEATFAAVLAGHSDVRRLGLPGKDELPWTLAPNLDPEERNEPLFTREHFGPFIAETALDAPDVAGFIDRAVVFANERLWGRLAAAIVVHPETLRDPRVRAAYERALFDLCYGVITVNTHPGWNHYAGLTTWGVFPASPEHDPFAGAGTVGNALMFRSPEKSVLTARFHSPLNPMLLGSQAMPLVARRLAEAQAHPSARTLAQLTLASFPLR
ncbi:MAG: aldehyde dehydrogenase family protein [Oscillochloridaceae bacterium]|nr:aldehyde dehydrogenase family protein [Chloroflexaceae bacterium]MDW8388931.1 aldehyde dehydrogenase family protein [Oscillochloridaceae bacterium]